MSKRFRLLAGIATLIPAFALLAQDLPANPKPNPYLAAEKYAITHFDSSQSDSFPYAVPRGTFEVDLRKEKRIVAGPVNIMTLASTSPSYMLSFTHKLRT
ncbi:UNVERIFIED_ORG: hypothetical protein BDU10_5549 [Burkholderia sp. CF145]|nr:hypothetical protein SAMN05445504_5766 [Burkholderia sp. CF099]